MSSLKSEKPCIYWELDRLIGACVTIKSLDPRKGLFKYSSNTKRCIIGIRVDRENSKMIFKLCGINDREFETDDLVFINVNKSPRKITDDYEDLKGEKFTVQSSGAATSIPHKEYTWFEFSKDGVQKEFEIQKGPLLKIQPDGQAQAVILSDNIYLPLKYVKIK